MSKCKKPILINKGYPLPDSYCIKTKKFFGEYELEETAADCAAAMIEAARADGIELAVISAYRSVEYQQKLFQEDVEKYTALGMTLAEAIEKTSHSLALPGRSEHNSGLALDILADERDELTEEFSLTKEYKWLMKNAAEFGFILRYPKGKENITKIIYEPWHFRYVGKTHALDIMKNLLTLEEYLFGFCCGNCY